MSIYTVSIHALLAECDPNPPGRGQCPGGFNPRTPCGVRPVRAFCLSSCLPFQSTHSLRSATLEIFGFKLFHVVSIHALLAECDRIPRHPRIPCSGFNPRTPCGVRLHSFNGTTHKHQFQSTHSLRSATSPDDYFRGTGDGFNPRTPCGVRP